MTLNIARAAGFVCFSSLDSAPTPAHELQGAMEVRGPKEEYDEDGSTQGRDVVPRIGSYDGPETHLTAVEGQEATRLDSHLSRHTYHGHRRNSFRTKDIDELTELRARRKLALSILRTTKAILQAVD